MITRERNSAKTKASILKAAEDAFAEKGFSGARVDEIAFEAGVNKALLYHYFLDKRQLYTAVLVRLMKRVTGRMQRSVSGAGNDHPETSVRKIFASFFDVVGEEPRYAKLFIQEAVSGWNMIREIEEPIEADAVSGKSVALTLDSIQLILRRGAAAGEFQSGIDFRLMVSLAGALCCSYFLLIPGLQPFYESPLDSGEMLVWARDQIIELFLAGISKKKTAPKKRDRRRG
jgi:TetR/AcrR family transcriptional regulator